MRACVVTLMLLLLGSVAGTATAADGTWFVVPGKRGIPVIVNPLGFDASYMIVEGDFGLDRPAQVNPIIVGGPHVLPAPYYPSPYFPSAGRQPGYGRLEVVPRRAQSRPGESYYRSWGAASDPSPATIDTPNPYPMNIDVGVHSGGCGEAAAIPGVVRVKDRIRVRVHTVEASQPQS